jgi:hypothetical protein
VERLLLPRVLEYTRGNQYQATRLLGIARQTLRQKLRDLGLSISRPAESDEDDPVYDCPAHARHGTPPCRIRSAMVDVPPSPVSRLPRQRRTGPQNASPSWAQYKGECRPLAL